MSISFIPIDDCKKKPIGTTVSRYAECQECVVVTRLGLHSPGPIYEVLRCKEHI